MRLMSSFQLFNSESIKLCVFKMKFFLTFEQKSATRPALTLTAHFTNRILECLLKKLLLSILTLGCLPLIYKLSLTYLCLLSSLLLPAQHENLLLTSFSHYLVTNFACFFTFFLVKSLHCFVFCSLF